MGVSRRVGSLTLAVKLMEQSERVGDAVHKLENLPRKPGIPSVMDVAQALDMATMMLVDTLIEGPSRATDEQKDIQCRVIGARKVLKWCDLTSNLMSTLPISAFDEALYCAASDAVRVLRDMATLIEQEV